MADYVIAIDYDKCTGCRICEIACSVRNTGAVDPGRSRIRVIRLATEGNTLPVPVLCMKCVEAFCKAICPVGAISDDPVTGARVVNKDKCIACSACVYACPFGAIAVDRTLGAAFNCNHCDGEPTCVQFCPRGALQYLDSSEVSIRLRRSSLEGQLRNWPLATVSAKSITSQLEGDGALLENP
jgi:carbon-monoxide dehydrogenase iron sulfur subunit